MHNQIAPIEVHIIIVATTLICMFALSAIAYRSGVSTGEKNIQEVTTKHYIDRSTYDELNHALDVLDKYGIKYSITRVKQTK